MFLKKTGIKDFINNILVKKSDINDDLVELKEIAESIGSQLENIFMDSNSTLNSPIASFLANSRYSTACLKSLCCIAIKDKFL